MSAQPIQGLSDSSSINDGKNKKIIVTYDNCDDKELESLDSFKHFFKIDVLSDWNDRVTHVIVHTLYRNDCLLIAHSKCFMNSLLSNCVIVTFDWIVACLKMKSLQHEIDYIPQDQSESAMKAWRLRHGMIDSPLNWTKNVILYFHSSTYSNDWYTYIIGWSIKAGFEVTGDLEKFNDSGKTGIILFDFTNVVPTKMKVSEWFSEYDAIVIHIDWILDCLFNYGYVNFKQYMYCNRIT